MGIDKTKYFEVKSQEDYINLISSLNFVGEKTTKLYLIYDSIHWKYVCYDYGREEWRLSREVNGLERSSFLLEFNKPLTEFPEIEELLNESKKITNT